MLSAICSLMINLWTPYMSFPDWFHVQNCTIVLNSNYSKM